MTIECVARTRARGTTERRQLTTRCFEFTKVRERIRAVPRERTTRRIFIPFEFVRTRIDAMRERIRASPALEVDRNRIDWRSDSRDEKRTDAQFVESQRPTSTARYTRAKIN